MSEEELFESTFPGYKALIHDRHESTKTGKYQKKPSNMFSVWLHCRAELAALKAGQGEAVGHPINLALSRDVGEILESVGINRSTVGGQRIIACCERAVARSSAAQPGKAREVLARLFCAVEHAETDTGGILVDCELQDEVRAAITAPPASADAVSVPRELLERTISNLLYGSARDNAEELRALLARQEVKS